MTGEKQRIYDILVRRGVIVNGVFMPTTFRKIVTEPSLYAKTMQYRFNELNGEEQTETEEIEETAIIETQAVDNEPVIEKTAEPIAEEPAVAEETAEPEVVAEETVEAEAIAEEVAEETVEAEAIAEEAPKKKSKKK